MVKITEKYYFRTDAYNYILLKKHIITKSEAEKSKNKKEGDIEYTTEGYYMTLESLLTSVYKKHKRGIEKSLNLTEYLEELKKIEEKFERNIKKMLKEGVNKSENN